MQPLNIIVLYGANATFTSTVMDHVRSFGLFSRHNVSYASIVPSIPQVLSDLSNFDVAVLHYSFFPGLRWKVPEELRVAVGAFRGYKILFLQDEYDHTDLAQSWIGVLGVQCVYTCVPRRFLPQVYPPRRFTRIDFRQTLTGFAPLAPLDIACPPPGQREIVIGYRGRRLHPRYGNLGREKWFIGERMRELCTQRGIRVDIESSEDKRIYGNAWYEFLASCRATLGTESGSNVLDADGSVRAHIDAALAADPDLGYEDLHARFIGKREGVIRMNQVSPRIFEAAALRTALVLFEGDYSGVVKPWEHYLPLRKDFGNADELLKRLRDVAAVAALTARAQEHLIASGKWSYQAFIKEFDAYVESRVKSRINAMVAVETLHPPEAGATPAFMEVVPESATDIPYTLEWLRPDLREPSAAEEAARERARAMDRANAEFWSELCGTQMAKELGIVDQSATSLARFDRAYLEFYPYLLERVPVHTMKGRTVLEIGLGYGTLGQCIVEAGADYVGLDVADLPVQMMQHRLRMQGLPGQAVRGSILNCPFKDGSVDVVVAIGCFHHTGDIVRCITETHRILRSGGRAYIMVYNKFSFRQWRQWPRLTWRELVRETSSTEPTSAWEKQRELYDANLSGKAAPETVFVSKAGLRRMFRQFSAVAIRSENSDPFDWRGHTIFSRETMLHVGWLWGLDLYVDAVK